MACMLACMSQTKDPREALVVLNVRIPWYLRDVLDKDCINHGGTLTGTIIHALETTYPDQIAEARQGITQDAVKAARTEAPAPR